MFKKNPRLLYFILIMVTIGFGLLSRKVTAVPLWVGDVLWATMVFYISRFIFIDRPLRWVIVISLIFCYGIELSQLYHAEWIDRIRLTMFGKLVLGSVFSFGDVLSYTAGVLLAAFSIRKL